MIVDAHVHVASPDTARFPRQPTGVGSDWWHHDASAESLLATLDTNSVDRAVIVQAIGVYGYDCRYAAVAVAEHPDRLALVGAVDMDTSDPSTDLQTLHDAASLRGVRLFGVVSEPDWLTDGRADAVWELCAELGLTIVPTLFAGHLDALGRLVAQHPGVPVAIDHCAFIEPDDSSAMATLLSLTELPPVALKITSHVLAAASSAGDPARFVDCLVEAFGTDRLCWGSDHPQHHELSYPQMLDLAYRSIRHLSPIDQHHVLATTSTHLWWPSPHRPSPH